MKIIDHNSQPCSGGFPLLNWTRYESPDGRITICQSYYSGLDVQPIPSLQNLVIQGFPIALVQSDWSEFLRRKFPNLSMGDRDRKFEEWDIELLVSEFTEAYGYNG